MSDKKLKVLKSSAGSGKTYALVLEYLKLVLSNPLNPAYYRHVLAITFTNAAAIEMKLRVLHRLRDFASGEKAVSDIALAEALCNQLRISKDELYARAHQVYAHMLHHYGQISISTIDSFTHKVIRSFASDLHLHQDFSIEMDADAFLEKVVDRLLSRVGFDQELTEYITSFVEDRLEDEEGWQLRTLLLQACRLLLMEESDQMIEVFKDISLKDTAVLKERWKEQRKICMLRISKPAADMMAILDRHQIGAKEFFFGTNGPYGFLKKLSDGKLDKSELPQRLLLAAESSKWYATSAPASVKQSLEGVAHELTALANIIIAEFDGVVKELAYLSILLKSVSSMGMLSELATEAAALREEENVLLIGDFHKKVAEVVRDSPAPFIYERIGEKYRHILFDEFQDTSALQWTNFIPLIENSLSTNQFNLIVGDGKQSIYRWRNGKVEQFVRLPEIDLNHVDDSTRESFRMAYDLRVLKANYRSGKAIIQFNNTLYTELAQKSELAKDVYFQHEQESRKSLEGFVQLHIIREDENKKQGLEANTKKQMLLSIIECLEDGFSCKDIVVLVRKKSQASLAAQWLSDAGFAVVTSESFLIRHSAEVRWAMAVLSYLQKPTEAANRSLLLIESVHVKGLKSEWDEISSKYIVSDGKAVQIELELFFKDLWPDLVWPDIRANAYESLDFLFRNVLNFENEYTECLLGHVYRRVFELKESHAEVLEWWTDNESKIYLHAQSEDDAIRIMTVHKSKGLQFPVVIYPIFKDRGPNSSLVWVNIDEARYGIKGILASKAKKFADIVPEFQLEEMRSELDDLNITYVATTRPEERLYILMQAGAKVAENGISFLSKLESVFVGMLGNENTISFGVKEQANVKFRPSSGPVVNYEAINTSQGRPEIRYKNVDTDKDETAEARSYGEFVHHALSLVRSPSMLDSTIQMLLHKHPDAGLHWVEDVQRTVTNPELSRWFDQNAEIIAEQDVVNARGQWLRPDRIVMDDDAIYVLDFKTGVPKPEHKDQVQEYAALLSEILNLPSKAFLYYTRQGELRQVI